MTLTVERIACALKDCGGFQSITARYLGTTPSVIIKWVNKSPTLQGIITDMKERYLDVAEGKVLEAINNGDRNMLKWYLSYQGRDRGYRSETNLNLKGKLDHRVVGGVLMMPAKVSMNEWKQLSDEWSNRKDELLIEHMPDEV